MEMSGSLWSVFGELESASSEVVEKLARATMGIVAADPRYAESEVETLYADLGEGKAKRAFAALAALATDMARLDAGASEVASTLEEHGLVDATKAQAIATLFERSKPSIRLRLGMTLGVSLPRLVDIDWRLDYVVRSSDPQNPSPLVPVYYVSLHVDKEGASDTIDLALSVEQMQDLLLTVKHANHQAARLATAA